MSLTPRDAWIRKRFAQWLNRCFRYKRVTTNGLSRMLAGNTQGDYRGTIRSYLRGTTTIGPDRAFEIGEAIAILAPCGWISGPYAVAIAGYYEELLAFCEAFHTLGSGEDADGGGMLAALHVPFLAELEHAELNADFASISNAAFAVCGSSFRSSFIRMVGHARRFAYRANTLRHAWNVSREHGLLDSSAPVEPYPVDAAWRSRREPADAAMSDPYASDRRTIVAIGNAIAGFTTLNPNRLAASILSMLWQWISMVDCSLSVRQQQQIDLLRRYFNEQTEEQHVRDNLGSYAFEEIIPGHFGYLPKSNMRVRAVPLEDRIDDLRAYDRALRDFSIRRLRAGQQYVAGPFKPWHDLHERYFKEDILAAATSARVQNGNNVSEDVEGTTSF
jgi:hypothetical protein